MLEHRHAVVARDLAEAVSEQRAPREPARLAREPAVEGDVADAEPAQEPVVAASPVAAVQLGEPQESRAAGLGAVVE